MESRTDPFDCILGESRLADEIRAFARRAARVDATVLLTGESGTGKGLLAHAIHDASARAKAPFVAVNCAGIADTLFESEFFGHARGAFTGAQQQHRGLFEQADRGTLFLDEVGDLASGLQAKLLTALEDGEIRRVGAERTVHVDFRAIAATGIDLRVAVEARHFRADLYHRLHVLHFRLPALRERPADLPLLSHYYLESFARRYRRHVAGFDSCALQRMTAHAWPGNIRELAHAIEAAILACDDERISAHHLPDSVTGIPAHHLPDSVTGIPAHYLPDPAAATFVRHPPAGPAGISGRHFSHAGVRYSFYGEPSAERERIEAALVACKGNRTRAAAHLGMARNTLRSKLRALHIGGAAIEEHSD